MDKPHPSTGLFEVFLGGADLEMLTIGDLARSAGVRVHDRGLAWGAKASDYAEEIAETLQRGHIPVLVELPWDLPPPSAPAILVDHHGERAGSACPSALRQIHELLGKPAHSWTREYQLIEANDVGWIPAMQAQGASADEIRAIRAADRAAQGVSAEEEQAAAAAVAALRWSADGKLAIVDSQHDRSAPITDHLHPAFGGPAIDNLLILGPKETQFFGSGAVIKALAEQYPNSWYGGALPARGYWGNSAAQVGA